MAVKAKHYRTGVAKELIEDGKNGLLFNQGDYIDLANNL